MKELLLCRAQTIFSALELMCSMPDDTPLTSNAMREGKGQREAAPQHMGGNPQRQITPSLTELVSAVVQGADKLQCTGADVQHARRCAADSGCHA